ncbi:hypothetical protein ABPG75_012050 [Micractinium tetrahymenae]
MLGCPQAAAEPNKHSNSGFCLHIATHQKVTERQTSAQAAGMQSSCVERAGGHAMEQPTYCLQHAGSALAERQGTCTEGFLRRLSTAAAAAAEVGAIAATQRLLSLTSLSASSDCSPALVGCIYK